MDLEIKFVTPLRLQRKDRKAVPSDFHQLVRTKNRRVVNLRLKSPESFWKLNFAETMIYLRAQLLYGRWKYLKSNWSKALLQDFTKGWV